MTGDKINYTKAIADYLKGYSFSQNYESFTKGVIVAVDHGKLAHQ